MKILSVNRFFVAKIAGLALLLNFVWVPAASAEEIPASCAENYADINEDTFSMTEIVVAIDGTLYSYPLVGAPTETVSQAEIEAAYDAAMTAHGFAGYYAITGFEQTATGLEIFWLFEGTDLDVRIAVTGNFDNNFNFDECSFDDAVVPVVDMRVVGAGLVVSVGGYLVYNKNRKKTPSVL